MKEQKNVYICKNTNEEILFAQNKGFTSLDLRTPVNIIKISKQPAGIARR